MGETGLAATWRPSSGQPGGVTPHLFLAMEHAGYLVLGRCNNAIGLVISKSCGRLPARKLLQSNRQVPNRPSFRGRPPAPCQALAWSIIGRRVEGVAWKIVPSTMMYGEDLSLSLPLVRLGARVGGAKAGDLGDLCRRHPLAGLDHALAGFRRQPSFNQFMLGRRNVWHQSLNNRPVLCLVAALNNARNEGGKSSNRVQAQVSERVVAILQCQSDDLVH